MRSHANAPRTAAPRTGLVAAAGLAALMGCSQGVGERAEAAGSAPGTAAATPRLADGHPDLNGTWDNGSGIDFIRPQKSADGSVCLLGCAPAARPVAAADRGAPPPNFPKYRAQFLAKVKQLNDEQLQSDPVLHCHSPGLPRIGPPDKIIQIPGQIVFLYDDVSGAFWRIVPTDGRAQRTDVEDSSLGDSIGHWEGDTLVVEATRFSDDTWLTDNGAFHTSDMRVTERIRRNGDTLEWQATVDDPKVLEQPWKTQVRIAKLTKQELVEPTPCVDQDLAHVVDKTHHDNPR